MNRSTARILLTLVATVLFSTALFAGSSPTLGTAPANLSCGIDGDNLNVSWDDMGVVKYAIEVTATYIVDETEVTRTFSYTSTEAGFSAPLSDFSQQSFSCTSDLSGTCVVDPISLSTKVKGLTTTRGGSNRSQNNPFSDPCTTSLIE